MFKVFSKYLKILSAFFLLVSHFGCRQAPEKNQTYPAGSGSAHPSGKVRPELSWLAETDSISLFFYKNPYTGDAERYTRFYSQVNTTDTGWIRYFSFAFKGSWKEDSLRPCRSEGKLFCFKKSKPLQTIYFSRQNRDCTHFFFIQEGRYYYLQPPDDFFNRIDRLNKRSR